MRVVLVGDIHASRKIAAPWRLASKRLAGMANLWLNRHRRFDLSLLHDALAHAASLRPDLLLFSGDLSTTALPSEFDDVARVFRRHVPNVPAVMVPGNHDRYTFSATVGKTMERYFADAMPARFPQLRRLSDTWHLLLIDGAVPRVAVSRGRLGRRQLADIDAALSSVPSSDALIILSHYPCEVPAGCPDHWDHRLADAGALRACLARHPRRTLFLHGHIHLPWCVRAVDASLAHVMMINAGSPTHRSGPCPHGHGFWHLDLPESADAPIQTTRHEPGPITSGAAEIGTDRAWRSIVTQFDGNHRGYRPTNGPIQKKRVNAPPSPPHRSEEGKDPSRSN